MSGTYTLAGKNAEPPDGRKKATQVDVPERCRHNNVAATCPKCNPDYVPSEDEEDW